MNKHIDIGKVAASKKVNQTKFTEFKIEMRNQCTLLGIEILEFFDNKVIEMNTLESVSDILFTYLVLELEGEDVGIRISNMANRMKALKISVEKNKVHNSGADIELKKICEDAEKIEGILYKVDIKEN